MTKAKTKTQAIHLEKAELIRRKKPERLKNLSGKVTVSYVRPSQRQAERSRRTKLKRLRNGHL